MVGQHAGHHRLADRHRADADAGIVAALGDDLHLVAAPVDRRAAASGSSWSASPRTAPRSAARWRCRRGCRRRGCEPNARAPSPIRISSALSSPDSAAAANPSPISTPLTALMPISARGEIGIELGVDRRAQTRRHALGHHLDHRAAGRAGLADVGEIRLPVARPCRVGAEERISRRPPPSPTARGRSDAAPSAPARRGSDRRRRAPAARPRPPRPASPSRAPNCGRRRDSRGCRISARR